MKCTCQSDYDSPCEVHGMNRPPSSALPGNEYPRAEGFNATTMSCDSCDYRTSSAIDATTHERSHRGHYVE